ncbi:MAG: ABC-F family ATP-binding cassette domain-containing protein [Peptococcaceae bacterium]|nr:ABC-F family ATP-binding cassette domain-containing protein [Peptococcaceae bacterium]
MLLLAATDLYKTHGLKTVFDHISLNIDSNDKIGLLGVNGTGKSTLLKILAGVAQADSGEIQTSNQLVLEYLPQHPDFDENATVLQQIFRGESAFMKVMRDYELAVEALEQNPADEALTQHLLELSAEMDRHNAWQLESEAKAILNKLGIHNFSARIGDLSGGQKKRIALAGALIRPCNLLILDEPTNHLDNDAIEFLEQHLKTKNCALLMVTHDRYFLDRVTNRIVELSNAKLYSYEGNYETFLELKTQREDDERRMQEKAHALYKQELAWMRKGVEARRTKQKARIERFYELEDSLTSTQEDKLEISLTHSRLGKKIIEIDHLHKTFDTNGAQAPKVCIDDFTYAMVRDDRIGIVGNNGMGKSTLLNIIAGKLPYDSGSVVLGDTVRIGYYTQDNADLPENMRVIDYVREKGEYIKAGDGTLISAARMLERFLFSGAQQHSLIGQLSGGEKRRLYLLGVLMADVNVLLLDEPTNDLDIQTLQILEDFIDHFTGPVIAVSHDRYFLDRIAQRIFAFEGDGKITIYTGNYSDYMEKKQLLEPSAALPDSRKEKPAKEKTGDTRVRREKLKFTYQEAKEYETIEDDIAALETQIAQSEDDMAANSTDFVKLNELANVKETLEAQLMQKMERWEYLMAKAEEIEKQK